MLFNSLAYLLLLPTVLLCYWIAPSRFRLLILLFSSYFFYMSWKAEYGLLLFGLTLLNYLFGLALSAEMDSTLGKHKRLCFIAAIASNLAVLAIFKYTNFFIDSSWSLLSLLSKFSHHVILSGPAPVLPIILPLGISFFVFEFIHYLVDVYKGQDPIKSPLRFGLFAAFFPSQIAGPIKRFEDFDEQALKEKKFDPELFQSGIFLIVQGLFKKVALGDNLAPLVAVAFSHSQGLTFLDAWTAVAAFTLQIYYDFSGYTDIGRGSANLLGYRLPENFNMPYIAKNASEFWHRWHISLSTWLRDYLYIPMGGSRKGKLPQMRNLLVTMLLGGLWHGASWTFVLWGAYQGLGLIVCHSWDSFSKKIPVFQNKRLELGWDTLSRLVTLVFIMFGWVLFRAENLGQFQAISATMLGLAGVAQAEYDLQISRMALESPLTLAFALYISFNLCTGLAKLAADKRKEEFCLQHHGLSDSELSWTSVKWWLRAPMSARIMAVAAVGCLILGLAPRAAVPFIYFQF